MSGLLHAVTFILTSRVTIIMEETFSEILVTFRSRDVISNLVFLAKNMPGNDLIIPSKKNPTDM